MPWLTQFLWRFLALFVFLPTIYGVFGWYIAYESESWSEKAIALLAQFDAIWEPETVVRIIYGAAIAWILLLTSGLTLLTKQVIVLFGTWFKSDTRAIISVLGWSFAVVVMVRWITFSAKLLILLCMTILGRLELQELGYNKWQIFLSLTILCLGGYGLGVLAYNFGNNSFKEETSSFYYFLFG